MRTIALLTMLLVATRAPADELRDAALRAAAAQAQAEAEVAVAGPAIKQALAKHAPAVPTYVWTDDAATPGQLNLWRGGVQVGAMKLSSGDYFTTTDGAWSTVPSDPPSTPSTEMLIRAMAALEKAGAVSPFAYGRGDTTTGTPAPNVAPPTLPSASSVTTTAPARTTTSVRGATRSGGITTAPIHMSYGVNCFGRT